jgi:flagellar basal-body rod protein FlgG
MHPALWIGKTGLDAQQVNISVITNNLANVRTTAFKKGRPVFEDLLYQNIQQPGGQASQSTELPTGFMLGTGVRTVATDKVFTEGSVVQTKNQLDVAINGRGFFQVLMPDGTTSYTRDGQFQVNSQGQLVTSGGNIIQPAITIPQSLQSLTIGSDGTVSAQVAGESSPTQVGTLELADFINPRGLQPVGENLFRETVASGSPQTASPGTSGTGLLLQGALEASNVNVVEELVGLIEAQRAYEMNSKAIDSVDNMLQFVVQTL